MGASGFAIVVVDLQAGTVANSLAHPVDGVIARAGELVTAFRERGLPVAFTRSTGLPAGRNAYGSGRRELPESWSQWIPELSPASDDIVVGKEAWSAFTGTSLHDELRRRDVSTVVVVGLATTFGIESTVRSAYDLGYDVIVVSDAITDPGADAHELAITGRFPVMARVLSTREAIEDLDTAPAE